MMALRRAALFSSAAAVALATLGACDDGGDGSSAAGGSGAGGGSGAAGGGGANACGAALCAAIGDACGSLVDACGQSITCHLCRYSAETAADTYASALSLAAGPSVQIAASSSDVTLATRGAPWTAESVAPGAGSIVDLAQAPDGTPWIAFSEGEPLRVAHRSNGAWTVDTLSEDAASAAIAVGSDGTPHVAWVGAGSTQSFGLYLASFTGGAWTEELVTTSSARMDLAVSGDEPQIVYWDKLAKSMLLARPAAGGFDTEVVVDGLAADDVSLALAFDAAGRPHVAYAVTGTGPDPLLHAVRENGQWAITGVASDAENGDKRVRIVLSPEGTPAIGFVGREGLSVATESGAGWLSQVISPRCGGESPFDIAFDASGTFLLAHACDGAVVLLERTGLYPEGYVETCSGTSATLCERGCECNQSGSDCCMHTSNGSGTCSGPLSYCVEHVAAILCGDATQEPALLDGCNADAAASECSMTEPGILLPDSCAAIF